MHWKGEINNLKQSCTYAQTAVSESHGHNKPKVCYHRYTHRRKRNSSAALKLSNHKGTKEERKKKRPTETNPKQLRKWQLKTYVSIITLYTSGLNAPTKRHRLAEWIQKQDPYICCLQETHFIPQNTDRLKVRGWKNTSHANGKQKQAGLAILVSDKIDLKIKKITRNKKGYYIMIKESI